MFKNIVFILLLGCSFCFRANCFGADKYDNSVSTKSENGRELSAASNLIPQNRSFHLAKVARSDDKLEPFIANLFSVIDVESAADIERTLDKGTSKLFIHSFFEKTPLLSEFLFQLSKEPQAISKFAKVFLQPNKLILFGTIFLSTMVLSHFMGEFKFRFTLLSPKRIAYAFFRFCSINTVRLGSFVYLFQENLQAITNIFHMAVTNVSTSYPVLYTITNIFL